MAIPPHNAGKIRDGQDFVVRGRRVITQQGERPAAIHIRAGVIAAVSAYEDVRDENSVYDVGDLVVIPGLVDTHVHINEPGRSEWEGFASATRAAAAGGTTTLIEMPLNSIPATTTVAGFEEKIRAATGKLWVDTASWLKAECRNLRTWLKSIYAKVYQS